MQNALRVPPHNTTLMGVIRGVADHFGLDHSDAMLYGATSHAFVINVGADLCPSGPYCWNPERFRELLAFLGISMTDHGFFHADSPHDEREALESKLKQYLSEDVPCSLINMENQLITGTDDTGFLLSQPWKTDFPPGHMNFTTWDELGDEIHMSFFSFAECEPKSLQEAVAASFATAVDMQDNPDRYTGEPYGMGPAAYTNWIQALEADLGGSHGNWWHGEVWGECRARAADYFREIGQRWPEVGTLCDGLAGQYDFIAAALARVADREASSVDKLPALREAADAEAQALPRIRELVTRLNQRPVGGVPER